MAEQTNRQPVPFSISAARRYLRLVVLAVLCIAALWVAIPALGRIQALLDYPYAHDGLEGTLLFEARLLRGGQPLYQPIELRRFISAPYPPVHYLALALLDLLPGPHVFWAGRLVSVIAALGVALLAALLVRSAGSPWAAAGLAAALVLSVPPLQLWGTRIKPDMLALFFTAAGLYAASRAIAGEAPQAQLSTQASGAQRSRYAALLLAIGCFVCAFFTKQTAVAGPLASGLALLATDLRDWRKQPGYVGPLPIRWRTLIFSGLYLALALGIWALLDLLTSRQYTLHVWWGSDRTRWWSFALFAKIVALLGFWWPQMLLAAIALPLCIRRRGLFVPVCYVLVAPLTMLGAGETGSNHNHLLETHLALAVAGCSAVGVALRRVDHPAHDAMHWLARLRPAGVAVLLSLIILQILQVAQPPAWYAAELAPEDPPERFLTFIRNTPGEILADDTGLLFQAGRELRYDDPSTMGPAAAIGAWDQSGLLDDIAQQRFSAIMIPVNVERSDRDPAGRWTPEMLAAIKQHYQLKFRDTIYTYVPR